MARARNIKPGFFTNDELADVSPLGRLLFIGLWTSADREGRLEDRPRRIKAELLPYDEADVDQLLDDLQTHGFILRYEAAGDRYIQVVNFTRHQNPHIKEPPSTIPAPDEHHTSTVPAPDAHDSGPADSGYRIQETDSGLLIPDSSAREVPRAAPTAAAKPPDVVLARFEQFWVAYPKRMGRDEALHAWRRVDWSKTSFEQLVSALGQHCRSLQWQKADGQYIPRAAKWLNERRWEEVLPEQAMEPPKQPQTTRGVSISELLARIDEEDDGREPNAENLGEPVPGVEMGQATRRADPGVYDRVPGRRVQPDRSGGSGVDSRAEMVS